MPPPRRISSYGRCAWFSFRPALLNASDWFDQLAGGVFQRGFVTPVHPHVGIIAGLAGSADTATLGIDPSHAPSPVALLDDLLRMGDAIVGHLRDVNQALDRFVDLASAERTIMQSGR